MNDTINNILTRRSVRAFTDKKISFDDLKLISQAACCAPNAYDTARWQFTVVQNKEKIQRLAKVIAEELSMGEGYDFYNPDALIIASNSKENQYGIEDCACALENIFLAAHSLGIGSVWINQLNGICDVPQIRKVLKELEVPENHLVWGMAALGYAAKSPAKLERKNAVKFIF